MIQKKENIKPIDIVIKYSQSFEAVRVLNTLNKLKWYNQRGYRVVLPRGVLEKIKVGDKKITKKQISHIINKEFNLKKYENVAKKIRQWWLKNNIKITKNLCDRDVQVPLKCQVWLTCYGTRGSYDAPNTIIVNIAEKPLRKIYGAIIHEIIHLGIEYLAEKFRVSHFAKERIVEHIFSVTMPNPSLFIKQKFPSTEEIQGIERILFEKPHIPVKEIIRGISKKRYN